MLGRKLNMTWDIKEQLQFPKTSKGTLIDLLRYLKRQILNLIG